MTDEPLGRVLTPFAGCPHDRTPLIATFEQRGTEWHCMTCGRYLPWLAARNIGVTDDITARYDDLRARFKAGERGPMETPT